MGNNEKFGIVIHHGGHFDDSLGKNFYVGGNIVGRYDLDPDTFGYFDVKGLVEKLGYISWFKLLYQIPKSESYRVLITDKEVIEMLTFLSHNCRILHVYVDGGVRQEKGEIEGSTSVDMELSDAHGLDEDGHWDSEENDSDYEPSDDDSSFENLDDLELTDEDEEYTESRRSHNIFDMIDNYVAFETEENGEVNSGSEYESSDGDINSSETDEEGGNVRRPKRIIYDSKCNHKDLDVKLRLRFQDGYECRDALKSWAIENGRFIRFKRVSKTQCEAKCKPPCPWRVYASIVPSDQSFKIKSYGGDHTCTKAMDNKLLSSSWIAKRYINVFRVRPNMCIEDLKADILERFACEIPKDRLYKARSIARELVTGTVEEHYASLRRYIAELRRVDRDGRYELLLGEGNVFKRLYIGHSSLKRGFKLSCRPVIGLDGCFLKTYLGGILLCAVGRDGNNQMFPISWAIVEIENEDCWTWFMKCLIEDLEITSGDGWTFISDQQKGLLNAVANLVPAAEHRNCARHVYMNWKKEHKGDTLKNLFWRAVRCTYVQEYKRALLDMKAESSTAFQDFIEKDVHKFCKCFLSTGVCSDTILNNISETFNGYILSARGKHIIDMLEEIRCKIMVRQVTKNAEMRKVTDVICPKIRKHLEKLRYHSRNCVPVPAMNRKFGVTIGGDKFVVDVERRTCACRVWELTGIPCVHAISALQYLNIDPSTFVDDYFNVSRYLEAYQFGIEPLNGSKLWPEVEGPIILPPLVRKMPGRPKKKRRRAAEEMDPKNPKRLKRTGLRMTCKNCNQQGHNSRGCKNEAVPKPTKEKGKRGRPKKHNGVTGEQLRNKAAPTSRPAGVSTRATFREKNFVKKGAGVYTSASTGNVYYHMPDQRRVTQIYQAPRNRDDVSTSGASQS